MSIEQADQLVGTFVHVQHGCGFYRIVAVKPFPRFLLFSLIPITDGQPTNARFDQILPYCKMKHQKDVYGPRPNWKQSLPIC